MPFELKEDRPVKLALRARIEDVGPELTTADNTALAEVRVVRQKIKVLFVAGHPFRNLNSSAICSCGKTRWPPPSGFRRPDKDYDQLGSVPLKRLPATPEELNDYDCVILYDPDPAALARAIPGDAQRFCGQGRRRPGLRGGGTLHQGFFDHPDDSTSAWLPLLACRERAGPFPARMSPRDSAPRTHGNWKSHRRDMPDPVLQFAAKPEENDRILASLPGMYWHFPVTRAKPGASVLARHADPRMRNQYGQEVLLATQLVGPGRSFFVGLIPPIAGRYLDEQTFDGFWAHDRPRPAAPSNSVAAIRIHS